MRLMSDEEILQSRKEILELYPNLGVSPMMPPSEKYDWWAPAGLNKGVITDAIKLKWAPILDGELPPIDTKDRKVTAVILEQSISKPIDYSNITRNICGR